MGFARIHDPASQFCSSLTILRPSESQSQTKGRQTEKLHSQNALSLVGFKMCAKNVVEEGVEGKGTI